MDKQIIDGESVDKNAVIDQKLRQFFDGKIVRKDLTKKIKEGANVPVYVLEFLLGQYCSSDDPEVVESGVENVKRILADIIKLSNWYLSFLYHHIICKKNSFHSTYCSFMILPF